MAAPRQSSLRNQLLAGLSAKDFAPLRAHLEPVELELRRVLIEPNEPIEHVYFHERGYTSITTNGEGSKIELGLIGREGMVGVPVALGVSTTPLQFFVQLARNGLRTADGKVVDAQAWEKFVTEVVVPRFPEGLTVIEASGHSNGPGNLNPTRILVVVHPNSDDAQNRLQEIKAEYRKRFAGAGIFHTDQSVRTHRGD